MTSPLRDLIALNEGARRNGSASDGKGWYRNEADREDCYAVADAVVALGEAEQVWAGSPSEPRGTHGRPRWPLSTVRSGAPSVGCGISGRRGCFGY